MGFSIPVSLLLCTGDEWGALVRYLLVAEQGDITAASNAAFMLQRGQGYNGPGHMDLAASLYERSELINRMAKLAGDSSHRSSIWMDVLTT
eukprot:566442-Pelagomonas_calceolata.AAC.15